MKKLVGLIAAFLLMSGCLFDVPVTQEHSTPIDRDLLGLWESAPGQENDETEWIMILAFSATEYLVDYYGDSGALYFRGYSIDVDGIQAIQLQALGDETGPNENKGNEFLVVSIENQDEELTIRIINADLIKPDLDSSSAIREAIIAHKDDENLFIEPMRFVPK